MVLSVILYMKDFFKNFKNSYWAGFISADGCLSKHKNGKIYSVYFDLSSKDHELLERLKYESNAKSQVKKFERVKWGKTYYSSRFQMCSKEMCDDLIELYNMSSNKTFEYNPPKDKLTTQQKREFIKGVIDGDGHIRNRKDGTFNMHILGTMGNLQMIAEHCRDLGLDVQDSKIKNKDGTKVLDLWGFNARTLFSDLYENVPQYLPRKWKKEFYEHCQLMLARGAS